MPRDEAMYVSTRGRHAAKGHYVPFICGYNSDAEDKYELIDIRHGKHAGTIGLPADEVGQYMPLLTCKISGAKGIDADNECTMHVDE